MGDNVIPLRKPEPRQPDQRAPAQRRPEQRSLKPHLPEPLWREVLGSRLRELRRERQEKLTDTAGRAGISPQYLSEVERGRKEPSSEMIAALAGAFDLTLIDLATLVTEDLRRHAEAAATGSAPAVSSPTLSSPALSSPIVSGPARPSPSGPVALLSLAA